MDFDRLVALRWEQAARSVHFDPSEVDLIWGTGEYPHFKTERGFGVTFYKGHPPCELLFSEKLLVAPLSRQDGIIRHEIGHVVDMVFPENEINRWALRQGVSLPSTEERRADAIALAIWGEPIRYDEDLVQSTSHGIYPRPRHLGL